MSWDFTIATDEEIAARAQSLDSWAPQYAFETEEYGDIMVVLVGYRRMLKQRDALARALMGLSSEVWKSNTGETITDLCWCATCDEEYVSEECLAARKALEDAGVL